MGTHRSTWRLLWPAAAIGLVLGACGDSGDDAADTPVTSTSTTAAPATSYTSTVFVVPFELTVPPWLPAEPDPDLPHFVTWETDSPEEDPPIRILQPVNVYRPGDDTTSPLPDDYLAYLLSQRDQGATFEDISDTTVDGLPGTLLTVTVADSLDGSLGCYAEDMLAEECYGLQPDLTLRMVVLDTDVGPLLIWLRHEGVGPDEDTTDEFAAFEEMLGTIRFRDDAPAPTTLDPATTPIVASWHRVYDCNLFVQAFRDAGLDDLIAEWGVDMFWPDGDMPTPDPCAGAPAPEFSRAFLADGTSTMREPDGHLVDDGTFTLIDDHTLKIGDFTVAFEIEGDSLTFTQITPPDPCVDECREDYAYMNVAFGPGELVREG
jgi:hypothetical protein